MSQFFKQEAVQRSVLTLRKSNIEFLVEVSKVDSGGTFSDVLTDALELFFIKVRLVVDLAYEFLKDVL